MGHAGWMGKERTLFVAEGLVRYLKAPVLEAMFRTAAQVHSHKHLPPHCVRENFHAVDCRKSSTHHP